MEQRNVMTVTGEKEVGKLGYTYIHEHLLVKPNSDDEKYYDYTLDDIQKIIEEVKTFKNVKGGTIVDSNQIPIKNIGIW